jgi:hypothetical protein
LYSAFNNPVDISFEPEFGAVAGFTQREIETFFTRHIEMVAGEQGMTEGKLLEKIKEYYNGFCFDGKTFVYNPYSMLLFLRKQKFQNFWYSSGTPDQLIPYMKTISATFEEYRGIKIERDRLENPSHNRFEDPPAYLYQMGYLTQRPRGSSDNDTEFGGSEKITLDYPNVEVMQSMARRLISSYFNSFSAASAIFERVTKALADKDPVAFVVEFNMLLARVPFDYHQVKRDECYYCAQMFTLFYAMGLNFSAEQHGRLGRSDFAVTHGSQSWIIELKVSHDEKDDARLAAVALSQIKAKDYGGGRLNPVLLAAVVNDRARAVTAWECEGGLAARPPERQQVEKEERSGPRPR